MSVSLAIVRRNYRPDGGAERIIERMLKELFLQYEFDVSVISQRWQKGGAPVRSVIVGKRGILRHQQFNGFVKDVQQALGHEVYDLVQSHERVPGCQIYRSGDGVHAEWLRLRSESMGRIQRLWQRIDPFHRTVLKTEKALFEHDNLRAVVCNSKQIKREILIHYPAVDKKLLHVIPNGVDLTAFKPSIDKEEARRSLGLSIDTPVLIYVGSGFDRKGLETILEALPLLPSLHLLVVGHDKRVSVYRKKAEQASVADQVTWVGVQHDVRPYYAAADMLVHPAWYDPFPNVILEALASGLPVITTDTCGGSELIRDVGGVTNGYVIKRGDVAALSDKLQLYLGFSTNERDSMAKSARLVAEQYPIAGMVKSLVDMYQGLLEKHG